VGADVVEVAVVGAAVVDGAVVVVDAGCVVALDELDDAEELDELDDGRPARTLLELWRPIVTTTARSSRTAMPAATHR